MRVLIIHNRYQIPGGEDRVVQEEMDLLRGRGVEVFLYERDNSAFAGLSPVGKIRHVWALPFVRMVYDEVRARIRALCPDVVHVHNVFYMISPAVYSACRDEGVPVVQTLHNFRLLCLNGLFFRDGQTCEECQERRTLWRGVYHRCFKESRIAGAALARAISRHWQHGTWQKDVARYIALSAFSREKFVRAGIPPEKIVVKGNFLFPAAGGPSNDSDGDYAVFIGRLSREKGIDVLARAWEGLDLPLKVIGSGPEAADLAARFRNRPVVFLGHQSPETCLRYLRGAACLMLPSMCYENSPRALIEAYACGVPVIASRGGSLPEMVADGETGLLFRPGDAGDLAHQVRSFQAGGRLLRDRLRQGAARRYEERHTPEQHYQFLRGLYEEVYGGGRKTAQG